MEQVTKYPLTLRFKLQNNKDSPRQPKRSPRLFKKVTKAKGKVPKLSISVDSGIAMQLVAERQDMKIIIQNHSLNRKDLQK